MNMVHHNIVFGMVLGHGNLMEFSCLARFPAVGVDGMCSVSVTTYIAGFCLRVF